MNAVGSMSLREIMRFAVAARLQAMHCRLAFLLFGAIGIAGAASEAESAAAPRPNRPPNVIVILMDDMGWRDVGFMGNEFVETPHLDQLAKQGLVFSQAYASAPNCAPTRACLMSGQYTPRHGIYTVVDPRQPPGSPWHKLMAADSKAELSPGVTTVAESLQARGYSTGFFGMWNLGRGRRGPITPGGQGFETVVFPENLGFAKDAYFNPRGDYLSDSLTDAVLEFIDQNQNSPFFVYLADHAVHAPYEPKPALRDRYAAKAARSRDERNDPSLAASVEAVDENVGRVMNHLRRLNLADNTLIVFTSDNGGTHQYTAPLRGGKGELYEGGVRVPLVVWWSALKNPGRVCDSPVASIDLYPTLLEFAAATPPSKQTLDGVSWAPLIAGEEALPSRRLFWHFPCYVGRSTPASAIRDGDFKLIQFFEDGGRHELYNLETDPHEERNLAQSNPAKADALQAALTSWQEATGALLPSQPNPAFDPAADRPRGGQQFSPFDATRRRGRSRDRVQ